MELHDVAEELIDPFFAAAKQLGANGFQPLGHVTREKTKIGQSSFVSIWINPAQRDSVQIIGVITPGQGIKIGTKKTSWLVVFRTEFTDDTSIVTSNSSGPTSFPPDPKVNGVRCSGITDYALLYRFHRARANRYRGGRTATLDSMDDAAERLSSEHRKTYARLVDAGYYVLDQQRQLFVPTYKGAYFMTYRQLLPFKQIGRYLRGRQRDKSLRELGFGRFAEFQASQFSPIKYR